MFLKLTVNKRIDYVTLVHCCGTSCKNSFYINQITIQLPSRHPKQAALASSCIPYTSQETERHVNKQMEFLTACAPVHQDNR